MSLTFGRRLAMARASTGRTATSVAAEIGKSKAAVSAWENDLAVPSLDDISRVSAALNVNQSWLAFGEGPMFPVSPLPTSETEQVPA